MTLLRSLALLTLSITTAFAGEHPHHELTVELQPESGTVKVHNVITLPQPLAGDTVRFSLRPGLTPTLLSQNARITNTTMQGPTQIFEVKIPKGSKQLSLSYQGKIQQPPKQKAGESRQFEVTTGIISNEGVFLDASSLWVPWLEQDELSRFTLHVTLPTGWDAVSQGERTAHQRSAQHTKVTWRSDQPQQEVYLIAAPFTEFTRPGRITNQAFLRSPDEALAQRYLDATERYLAMYERLLGPYPYKKFALVENFWETGYGMPSFTLLGSQVIRMPFILNSSYPHEILHNWWGNGVYVDYASGNWSEGLTSYLADHLLQEQQGKGVDYRRNALQKYTDFAAASRDFALNEFRGRFSQASEAVGYGKTMMLMHMLRRELGDSVFTQALQRFYRDNLYRSASFSDMERAFSTTSGRDLGGVFRQWVQRSGAPQLALDNVAFEGAKLRFTLRQTQAGDPYRLQIPVAITLQGQSQAMQLTVEMDKPQQDYAFNLPAAALRVDIDPEFDLFRRLDQAEIPPALSLGFGAERRLIILPAAAPAARLAAYQQAAAGWARAPGSQTEVVLDNTLDTLPTDRAVYLIGWENRFRDQLAPLLTGLDSAMTNDRLRIAGQDHARDGLAAAFVLRQPGNHQQALVWLAADDPAAIPGLFRKLPHYAQSSYAVFTGSEPRNIAKGMWPVTGSPLTAMPTPVKDVARATLAARPALVGADNNQ